MTEKLEISSEQQDSLMKQLGSLLKERMILKQSLQKQSLQNESANEELLMEILEVFDALESLLNYLTENPDPNPQFLKRFPKSLTAVQKKLLNILQRRQVNLIDFQESKPDFKYCQVVDCELRDDLEEHTITKVVRQGFTRGEKLLRPLEVITAKPSQE